MSSSGVISQSPAARPFPLPPWLWPSTPREPLGASILRARWLLAGYWLLTGSGYLVLAASVYSYGHMDAKESAVIAGLFVASVVGIAVGNLLALLRLRPWVVQAIVYAATTLSCTVAALGGAWPMIFAITFLWSLGCGHFTLQRRLSLASLWIPVICWAGTMIGILEKHGRLHAWESGHKEGVWEPLTLGLLFLMVVQVFLFFAGQENYHALVWQAHGANATPTVTRHHNRANRLTGRGLGAMLVLAAAVCASTALVAPYLWRTGPAPDRGNRHEQHEEHRDNYTPDTDWSAAQRMLERALHEAERQGRNLLPFVPLFLLNRPLRRWWLLRQMRRPLFPVSPTRRAAGLWRYVRVALGDVGLTPTPGESIDDTVARVNAARAAKGLPPVEGLADAAGIYQRVRYGLGIPEGSLDELALDTVTAHRDIRQPMDAWARIKSWWRTLEN